MKFSVVIPCYNAERWIDITLQSVAKQTYPAYEIIVVDDGSTDNSLEYINKSQIPVTVLQTKHLGPAEARNAGIAAAKGDWVAFLDADDWWKPDHLERIHNLVGNSSDVAFLAAAEHYSINVNRVVSMSDTGPFTEPINQVDYSKYMGLYLKHGILELSSMAVAINRLREVQGFDSQVRGAEDLDLILKVIYQHSWAYDPVPSSVYRCNNPESYSRKAQSNEIRLTAKFKTLVKYQQHYNIADSLLKQLAQTLMSKAITDCEPKTLQNIKNLVNPYLSSSQQKVFMIAGMFPPLYKLANNLRHKIKGPRYGPRKVINPDSKTAEASS